MAAISQETRKLISEAFQPRADYYEIRTWGPYLRETLSYLNEITLYFQSETPCWASNQFETAIDELSDQAAAAAWFAELDALPKEGESGIRAASPITSSLVNIHHRPQALKRFHLITLAHTIHAARWWRDEIERHKNPDYAPEKDNRLYIARYQPNLESACRAIRRMSDDTLEVIAWEVFDPDNYYVKLITQLEDMKYEEKLNEKNRAYLKNLERMLAFAYQSRAPLSGPLRRRAKSKKSDIEERVTKETVALGADQTPSVLERHMNFGTSDPAKREKKQRQHKAIGLATAEELSAIELHKEASPIKTNQGDSPLQSAIRSQVKSQHMTKNAQLTPYGWSDLSRVEIRHLCNYLTENSEKDASVVLALILMTGRSLENVIKTRVVRTRHQLPHKIAADDIFILTEEAAWVSGVIEPESRRQLNDQWVHMVEPVTNKMIFDIPAIVLGIVSPSATQAKDRMEKRSAALFIGIKASDIKDDCRSVMATLTSRHRTRITVHRIEKLLFNTAISGDGDIADACLISGHYPPTGNVSSLYYYSPTVQHLRDVYTKAMDVIQHAAGSFTPRQFSMISTDHHQDRVGSLITPTEDCVSQIATELIARYQKAVSEKQRIDYMINAHNALTVYTVMMMMFSTGYRSVRDPLSDFLHVNARRKTIVIADKVDNSLTNSRVVPAAELFIHQLHHYRVHSEFMKGRLNFFFEHEITRPFFLLTSHMEPKEVTPERLQRHLSLTHQPPLNMNRHYLRTRLRELNVPGEYVDMFMGHWGIDQMPLGRHSTLSPQKYLASVRHALDSILSSNHWKVVKGFA